MTSLELYIMCSLIEIVLFASRWDSLCAVDVYVCVVMRLRSSAGNGSVCESPEELALGSVIRQIVWQDCVSYTLAQVNKHMAVVSCAHVCT